MKKCVVKMFGLVVLAVVVVSLSGCANQGCSALKEAGMIEKAASKNVEILWADSHQVDDSVIVHGAIKRASQGSVPMKAHIDVTVLAENGDILQEVHTPEVNVPRNQPGKAIQLERFEIDLKNVPVENSTIVVSAHQGCHTS